MIFLTSYTFRMHYPAFQPYRDHCILRGIAKVSRSRWLPGDWAVKNIWALKSQGLSYMEHCRGSTPWHVFSWCTDKILSCEFVGQHEVSGCSNRYSIHLGFSVNYSQLHWIELRKKNPARSKTKSKSNHNLDSLVSDVCPSEGIYLACLLMDQP